MVIKGKNQFSSIEIPNNIRDFFLKEFDSTFDYNLSQIIELFKTETIELCEKILSDTSDNVVNQSNYNELLEFASLPINMKRKNYKLKYDNYSVRPIEFSTNNIKIGDEPIIPGDDKIKHIYKLDGYFSKVQENNVTILSELLKKFSICENCGKEELIAKIKESTWKYLDAKMGVSNINTVCPDVPLSYCIPMSIDPIEKEELVGPNIKNLYKPGCILNVYSHIDKDRFFDTLIMHVLFRSFNNEKLIETLDTSNYKTFFRGIIGLIITELSTSTNIVGDILSGFDIRIVFKNSVKMSVYGSVSKYYENMSTYGVKNYIIKVIKDTVKNTSLFIESGYDNNVYNRGSKDESYSNVIYGTKTSGFILEYIISEVIYNKLYKASFDKNDMMFEFIISNIYASIISFGSTCLGEKMYDNNNDMGAFIKLEEDEDISDGVNPKFNQAAYLNHINMAKDEYYKFEKFISDNLIKLLYSIFMIKYVYDLKKRYPMEKSISSDSNNYLKTMTRLASQIINKSIYDLNILFNYVDYPSITDKTQHYLTSRGDINKDDKPEMSSKDHLGKIIDEDNNIGIKGKITFIPTLIRLIKNFDFILNTFYYNNGIDRIHDDFKVSGGRTNEIAVESITNSRLFSLKSKNMFDSYIPKTRSNKDIKTHCADIIKTYIIAKESEDEELMMDTHRQAIGLFDVIEGVSKNPDEETTECIKTMLRDLSSIM